MSDYDNNFNLLQKLYKIVQPADLVGRYRVEKYSNGKPDANTLGEILRIFVDTASDVRLIRRMERDTAERGRSVASVVEQYTATVRPMFHKFVEPSKEHADLVVQHGSNARVVEVLLAWLQKQPQP